MLPSEFPLSSSENCLTQSLFSSIPLAQIQCGLQAILQGSTVGLMSDFIAKPYLQAGELRQLFADVEIQKWQLFLYRPYETITPLRVLKVFEVLEGILKEVFKNQ